LTDYCETTPSTTGKANTNPCGGAGDTLEVGVRHCKCGQTISTANLDEFCPSCMLMNANRHISALEAELAGVKELLTEVWNQFAIEATDGRRRAGGLSVLEDVAMALGIPQ